MLSSSECITWFAVVLIVSVAIVTVNVLSIIIFIKNSDLRTLGMYLVVNLTVADTLVGVISSLQLLRFPSSECKNAYSLNVRFNGEGYMITWFLFYWFSFASLTNITVISLDRMHATFRPFRHRVIKKWVYGVTISVVWVLAAMVSTAIMMLLSVFDKEWSHHQYLWQSYSLLCLFVICSCYASIIHQNLLWARPQHHGAARRKLTVTLLIMKIVSVLLWLPFTVATFVYHTTDSIRSLSDTKIMRLNMYLLLLFYTNSFVNPVVYTITMPEYRKALLLLFTRRQRQNTAVIPLHAR